MSEGQEVEFRYFKDANYRTVYANGVHGGITTRGDLKMDFFVESPLVPDKVFHNVTKEGLGPETGREPDIGDKRVIQRESQVGVVVSLEQAKSIAYWLLKNIRDFEEAKQKGGKDDE